jgi:glycosyltransferase involved in cell wall biosynthesis
MTASEPRRVLIATHSAISCSGADLYTRDLALALLRRGWQPVVYATVLGAVAEELRQATIPVTSDITAIAAAPDVIHGHHHLETLTALARFPGVPALFVCHDGVTWHSTPPRTPRIGAYAAVDRNCRDRLMMQHGIAEVRIVPNGADLERFRRRDALPARPQRALIFSNAASETSFAAIIASACSQRGIALDVTGRAAGNAVAHPEDILATYDLVFGKARCALEAAATGTAVIVCDAGGLAGLITTRDVDAMRPLNFGMRLLQRPITEETIGAEIDRYDPDDAARVTDAVRATAGVDLLAEQFIEIYGDLSERHVPISPDDDLRAIADSLSHLSKEIQLARPADLSMTERALRSLYRRIRR